MKIGIDAKWYFEGPPSGRVVIKNLVDKIISLNKDHIFYLFVNYKYKLEALKLQSDRVVIVLVKLRPNLLSNFIEVPYWSNKLKLDLVIYQSFSSFFPSKGKKLAFIFDMLFLDYPEYFSKLELMYFKAMAPAARNADHIITISNTEKQRFVKYKIAVPDNISVINLGVNQKFRPLEYYDRALVKSFKLKNNIPDQYLLYVGRLNVRKNIVNLIKSLNYIKDKNIKLLVVGGIDYKADAITRAIQTNKLEDRILFTGHVSEEDLYLYYACSKAFCFPSFAEGFGIPPIEAMKCGVPTIVSDRTALPEVCGDAGVYINPKDPHDIAQKIDMLLSDEDFYRKKQQQSIMHARDFTWDRSALEFLSILDSLS